MYRDIICSEYCEDYLKTFFNSICEGFAFYKVIYNANGEPINYTFIEVNDIFCEITGLKRDELIGKSVKDIYPDIEPFWIEIYGKVALTGESVKFEQYFKTLDKYFKVGASSPELGKFFTILTDITDLKKTRKELKIHQILVDNAHDIILYAKPDGSILDANKAAVQSYGYTLVELLAMKIQDIRHPSTLGKYEEQMQLADTVGIVFENIHIRKDGTSFPVEVSARSIEIYNEKIRIHIIRDITDKKASEEKIAYLANFDSLTGIPNRASLMQQFDMILEQAVRGKYKVAVMFFDINKFKHINDTYGHQAGDIVLKETAARVQNSIRKVDIVGRMGGDEFVIIQPFINSKDDAAILAQRVLDSFKSPVKANETEISMSMSIGISIYPDDSDNKQNLLNFSDDAMYVCKQKGGNSYAFYTLDK